MKHQLDALNIMRRIEQSSCGGVLADECGLGKTITAALFAKVQKEQTAAELLHGDSLRMPSRPDLIVCPVSQLSTWKNELLRVANWPTQAARQPRILTFHGQNRVGQLHAIESADFVITSHTTAASSMSLLRQKAWSRVFLDEAHVIRNDRTNLAQAMYDLVGCSQFRWCITATPFNNRITDLASIARFIGTAPYDNPAWWRENSSTEHALNDWRSSFVIRRTKEAMLQPPIYHDTVVSPTEKEAQYTDDLRNGLRVIYDQWVQARLNGNNLSRIQAQAHLLAMVTKMRIAATTHHLHDAEYEQCGKRRLTKSTMRTMLRENAKMRTITRDIRDAVQTDPTDGVVLFSQFTRILDVFEHIITACLPDVRVYHYRGSMSSAERDKVIAAFNASKEPRVILVSLMAGNVGLSLQAGSSRVFIAEPCFNPYMELQAEERVHRIGQTRPVHVHRYVMDNSVETWISKIKEGKRARANALGLDHTYNGTKLSDFNVRDIHELFTKYVSTQPQQPQQPQPPRSVVPMPVYQPYQAYNQPPPNQPPNQPPNRQPLHHASSQAASRVVPVLRPAPRPSRYTKKIATNTPVAKPTPTVAPPRVKPNLEKKCIVCHECTGTISMHECTKGNTCVYMAHQACLAQWTMTKSACLICRQ